ncbi:arginine and glutamate-rich protein 1-like [Ambystoma mexicanum]|uniref:arginine and glutamate-rich protein 1-like n=1 Tax=Ambystoma mexicanum TaxID=8296 RepID=UPI0037E88DB5
MEDTKKERERARSRTPEKRSRRHSEKIHHYSRTRQGAREDEQVKWYQRVHSQHLQGEQENKRKNSSRQMQPRLYTKPKYDKYKENEKISSYPSRDLREMGPQCRATTKLYSQKPRKWEEAKWQIKLTQVEENNDKITLNRNSVLKLFKYIRNLKHIKSEELLVVEPSHRDTKARTYLHIASTTLKNTIIENKSELENMGYDLRVYPVTHTGQKQANEDGKRQDIPDTKLSKHQNLNSHIKKSHKSPVVKEKTRETQTRAGQKPLSPKKTNYHRRTTEEEDKRKSDRVRTTNSQKEQNQEQQQKKTESNRLLKCAPMKGIWSWLPRALTEKKQK